MYITVWSLAVFVLSSYSFVAVGQSPDSLLPGRTERADLHRAAKHAGEKYRTQGVGMSVDQKIVYATNLCELSRRLGKLSDADEYAFQIVRWLPEVKDSLVWSRAQLELAEIYAISGRAEAALLCIRRLGDYVSRTHTLPMTDTVVAVDYQQTVDNGRRAYRNIGYAAPSLYSAFIDSLLYEAYKEVGDHDNALRFLESFHMKIRKIEQQLPPMTSRGQDHIIQPEKQDHTAGRLQRSSLQLLLVISLSSMVFMLIWVLLRFYGRKFDLQLLRDEKNLKNISLHETKELSPLVKRRGRSEEVVNENMVQGAQAEAVAEDRRDLYGEMLRMIEDQKLYLNPELNQKIMVMLLGTNRNYLSQAINQHTDEHFTQIINRYRVNEAKRLLEQRTNTEDEFPPEEVYTIAGFNSITSYYRIFKHFTGLTPKEYQLVYKQQYPTGSR
jgi:AraC-like DNA-binding protein